MGTKFPVHLSGNEEIADEVGGGRQDPGERIDDVNHLDPVVGWKPKYGRQPDEPGGAGAHQRDQHGQNVVPHATQRTDDHIHDGVQTIEQGDPAEAHHTGCHHLGAGGIDPQKLRAEIDGQNTQKLCGHNAGHNADHSDLLDASIVTGAVILAGKGHVGLIEGVDVGINELLNADGGRAAGHNDLTEGVDGGLHRHVGQREQHSLNSGGDAHLHDLLELDGVDLQLPEVQPQRTGLLHEAADHQCGRNALGDHGGQCHACHIHVEVDDKDQIQDHVDNAGCEQVIERSLGIAAGPQQSGAKVVEHGGGHAGEVDPQVERGQTDHCQEHAAVQGEQDGGVDRFAEFLVLMSAEVPGSQNVGADGQS